MSDRVLTIVRHVLSAHTNEPRLYGAPPEEVSLQSLAIPSVEMIGIVIELEDQFGRVIDEARVHDLRTIADVVRALEEPCDAL